MKNGFTQRDIAAAVTYIKRYACEGLGVVRLVQETQRVSAPVFSRHFRAATGLTPQQAIRRRQLEEARRLLAKTELSLAFIAESSGFRDAAALERALRTADGKAASRLLKRSHPPVQDDGSQPQPAPVTPPPANRLGLHPAFNFA